MKRFCLWFCMLLGCAAAAVYLSTAPGCACGNIFPARIYNLKALDPLRDRAPEQAAQDFLHHQGQGKCRLSDPDLCAYALGSRCVLDWRLEAREDNWDGVVLYYRVMTRENGDELWGQAAVWVDREASGWTVVNYSAVY